MAERTGWDGRHALLASASPPRTTAASANPATGARRSRQSCFPVGQSELLLSRQASSPASSPSSGAGLS